VSESLRDQLVKAGLATKNAAKRAAKQQSKHARQKRAGDDDHQREARQAHAAKVSRDRELELERKADADRKARQAEIRQLVEHNRLPPVDEDIYFNFVDGGRVRRLAVTTERRERIVRGELVIVRHGVSHAVVPCAVAERIRSRDAEAVVTLEKSSGSEVEDGYKDYVVPDDLLW
jgi:uncharacterized protein